MPTLGVQSLRAWLGWPSTMAMVVSVCACHTSPSDGDTSDVSTTEPALTESQGTSSDFDHSLQIIDEPASVRQVELQSVALQEQHAYALRGDHELVVFDITLPQDLTEITRITVPLATKSLHVVPQGLWVAVRDGKKLMLLAYKTDPPNPPQEIARLELDGQYWQGLVQREDVFYAATATPERQFLTSIIWPVDQLPKTVASIDHELLPIYLTKMIVGRDRIYFTHLPGEADTPMLATPKLTSDGKLSSFFAFTVPGVIRRAQEISELGDNITIFRQPYIEPDSLQNADDRASLIELNLGANGAQIERECFAPEAFELTYQAFLSAGDRGYLQQFDGRLLVVDLSHGSSMTVVGETSGEAQVITSELRRIGDRLLRLGRVRIEEAPRANQGDLVADIFDVADSTSPKLLASLDLSDRDQSLHARSLVLGHDKKTPLWWMLPTSRGIHVLAMTGNRPSFAYSYATTDPITSLTLSKGPEQPFVLATSARSMWAFDEPRAGMWPLFDVVEF